MRLKIQISPQRGHCLVCGERMGFLRRLTGKTFCCDDHEQHYLADLRALAFTRLQDSGAEPSRTRSTVV
jgi:hypothetical protein